VRLSDHFSLEELTFSQIAARSGLDNTPTPAQIANLTRLCETVLEPARVLLGLPLHIDSGFRSATLNVKVGGARSSAHMDGRAADFKVGMPLAVAFDQLRRSTSIPYDQILLECASWIHIAITPDGQLPRREAFTAAGRPGSWKYERVT